MQKSKYDAIDSLLDEISELIGNWLESTEAEPLRDKLSQMADLLGEPYLVNLDVSVEVCDDEQERDLPLMMLGLSAAPNEDLELTSGDSSLQRYIVDGEMVVVPHDCCPRCWNEWDFKWLNPASGCDSCGCTLGVDCKILLDNDLCPFCEEGKVSMTNPKCDHCGQVVDLDIVEWG